MKKNKVLHLGFHDGCATDVKYVVETLGYDFTHMRFNDGVTDDGKIYNVSREIANNAWNKYKDFYNSFDIIITSDTAPISRTFLQNNFEKKLIIWVCNRFDWLNPDSYDGTFPDQEYYQLIESISRRKNVNIFSYTEFEHLYAAAKNIFVWNETIKPVGAMGIIECEVDRRFAKNRVPEGVIKEDSVLIPPYQNDTKYINTSQHLNAIGVKNYQGPYGGPKDIIGFKGIVHIPYAWSNLALFENLNLELVYFIPSLSFFRELCAKHGFFWSWPQMVWSMSTISEWYNEKNKDLFVYFDSWDDLKEKIETTDYKGKKRYIKKFMKNHIKEMFEKWRIALEC